MFGHLGKPLILRLAREVKPGGQIFVAVRNDTSQLRGWTKKDTFQTLVTLPKPWVLIREASGGYKIYGYKNR